MSTNHGAVQVERVRLAQDARGTVFEPLRPAELSTQQNVHVVLTEPGCVRANHYHERGTEIMIVQGPALVRVQEADGLRDFAIPGGEVHRFTIPPRVAHALLNTGPRPNLSVAFNTEPHDPARPDVVRAVVIPPPGGPAAAP